ncbi:haloacid dehalogenase type II [Neorhodopirellula lusitana]|uniref:haloacid dehalogenase type II n=1 Tax=Neorhodopirellula lusitana TaxID=445327 RepID=UPI00384D5AA1
MRNTHPILAAILAVLTIAASTVNAQQTPTANQVDSVPDSKVPDPAVSDDGKPVPKVIILDVNETLLSLEPLKVSVGKALGGREDLLPLWFSTMLHYSLVETLSNNYHNFGEIGTAALMMVAETQGIQMTYEEAKEAIVPALRSLPPHPDVIDGLRMLKASGIRLVSLTNSSTEGVVTQMQNAGLTDLVEKRYSVETVKKYKPHPDPYQMVLDDLGVKPEEVLMVAAHAWDLAGAQNVGLQTAFVARPGKTLYPNLPKPDYVVNDLIELARLLESK